jgi:hypothetical protein
MNGNKQNEVKKLKRNEIELKFFLRGNFLVCYSTLLHLPPLRFYCVGGCWDRTQVIGIDSQTL